MPIVMERPPAMTFGAWLEQRLIDASIGPSEFARMIGSSPNTVSHWFNHGGKPYRKTCYAIAEALGVPVLEVLERAGHSIKPVFIAPDPSVDRMHTTIITTAVEGDLAKRADAVERANAAVEVATKAVEQATKALEAARAALQAMPKSGD